MVNVVDDSDGCFTGAIEGVSFVIPLELRSSPGKLEHSEPGSWWSAKQSGQGILTQFPSSD